MVLLTKGADELRLIVVKQTLLDKEQRRCKGSYSQKGAATDIKPHLKICKPGVCYRCGKASHLTSKRIVENNLSRNHLNTRTASIELRYEKSNCVGFRTNEQKEVRLTCSSVKCII